MHAQAGQLEGRRRARPPVDAQHLVALPGGRKPPSALRQSRMFCHTHCMVQKIAVTLDQRTVADLDRWVREGRYPNRSRALQSAVNLLSEREKRTRLARELAKIDPKEEMQLAEQGLGDHAWPEY